MTVLSFGANVRRHASSLQAALHRHPRRSALGLAVVLCSSGFAAFGVAPMTPFDTNTVATREIRETVSPVDLSSQVEANELRALALHRSDQTRASDTADTLLTRLGIDDAEAANFLRQDPTAQQALLGRPGKLVQASLEQRQGSSLLVSLVVRGPAAKSEPAEDGTAVVERNFTRLTIQRQNGQLVAHSEQVPLQVRSRLSSGRIESSLFAAADEAELPDAVTMQVAEIFGSEIDFRRDLRKGDHFAVLYETLTADGQPISWGANSGRVLAARFINKGDRREAYWFEEPGQRGGYYGADGRSKTRQFLGSPLAFSRVTSGFAMRFHPIQKTWKAHLGVDYGAPTGTPVRAVGQGVVHFAGWQNGYGNVVELRHSGDHSTVYAHLSRISVARGQRVEQGQLVGAVGATGWATGPHLHFEFKVGNRHVDPLKIARSSEAVTLSATAQAKFLAVQRSHAEALGAAEAPLLALARAE